MYDIRSDPNFIRLVLRRLLFCKVSEIHAEYYALIFAPNYRAAFVVRPCETRNHVPKRQRVCYITSPLTQFSA